MASNPERFHIRAVMSRTGHSAHNVAANQRADYATTDYEDLLKDPEIDLIMIASRHDSHGEYVVRALGAGKHVFVEKPLTLDPADVEKIKTFYGDEPMGKPVLLTGFNRRFSPAATGILGALQGRTTPMIVNYRMNAGYIAPDHWVHGAEGGGRNIGEACHIYDLFGALTGANPSRSGDLDRAGEQVLVPQRQFRRHRALCRRLGLHADLHRHGPQWLAEGADGGVL